MGIETRGRPRKQGERHPGGELKREPKVPTSPASTGRRPITGALWQRMLADGEKIFSDAKFGTELTRLGAVGQLTPSEVATGIRVAGIYGRFEYYANKSRSTASPHYIREFIAEGAGSDTEAVNFVFKEGRERDRSFNPDDREVREREATTDFKTLQRIVPAELRAQLEMLCVEDCHVGYQGLIRARLALALVNDGLPDKSTGLSKKQRRAQRLRIRPSLPEPTKAKPVKVNSLKDAFIKLQRTISPHLADDDLEHAWNTLCALKAREDFRQAKSEHGSNAKA
jgi:hypothetical protein